MGKRLILTGKKSTNVCDVEGFLEVVTPFKIAGWAVSHSVTKVELALQLNGNTYALDADWSERQDVVTKVGSQKVNVGFVIQPAETLQESLARAIQLDKRFNVLANGTVLPLARGVVPVVNPHADLNDTNIEGNAKGNVEAVGLFTVSGWATDGDAPVTTFELLCNTVSVDFAVVHNERRDVAEALQITHLETGFDIELPGYIWENVSANGTLRLELKCSGLSLSVHPIEINRSMAARWVTEIFRMEDGHEKQYRALLALEHIRYGKLFSLLDEETALLAKDYARQMQLEDFVFVKGDGYSAQGAINRVEDGSSLLLWKALRQLNTRLQNSTGSVFQHVKGVVDDLDEEAWGWEQGWEGIGIPNHHQAGIHSHYQLIGEARERYLLSTIPLLCRHGEFLQLRKLIDFTSLRRFESSDDLWEVSLAIAPLVAEGHVDEAVELFLNLSKKLSRGWSRGWLNTECIRFAVGHVQTLAVEGEIDFSTSEKFSYAFISLLDAFNGEWFSRLHDQELIDSMIELLINLDHFTDYFKRDLVSAVIRHYGLCPTFWQRLSGCMPILEDVELARAADAFKTLRIILDRRDAPLAERLEELLKPITYFIQQGCSDALIVLREVVANSLPRLNDKLDTVGKMLLETLLDSDQAESLRIAAFPFKGENVLQSQFLQTSNCLFQTLRELSECDKSMVYALQCLAATTLQSAYEAVKAQDSAALEVTLRELESKAIALANKTGGFLGADLLASAYLLACDTDMESAYLLRRLSKLVNSAILETEVGAHLPAPICTALVHLVAQSDNTSLCHFVRETQVALRSKFGWRHDQLFARTSSSKLSVPQKGWPQDTLVVIYSCRKHLDTRVKDIRETWVQDLNSRGIPYVVLVGDGDDTVQGDVLALNVSDKYEDLPQKSLKLFDWVYYHTEAQYVLKIDDDCYLDVARYFDSLSYRKHNYYGRVIQRGVGSMDRVWHQSKSFTPHGQKSIDKSPEPSVYADGGGGYCLSRLAIQQLLEAEKTPVGERLIACSFMEDKLVGDLLALRHIVPSNEDYESYQRRRTFGDAMPVAMVENTFFPSKISPTKVVHLDTDKDFATTQEKTDMASLWPKKLWPTCWPPAIKPNSNQLELLTDPKVLEQLVQEEVLVVSVVRNEMTFLPHFLEHYRSMGLKCFIFVDNCSDDGSREYLYAQSDVVLYSSDTEYKYSHYGVAWQQALMGNLCLGKWVLLADADEFLIFEGSEHQSLFDFIEKVESDGSDAVRTDMIDMYPFGDLEEADFDKHAPFDVSSWFDADPLIKWNLGSGMYSNSSSFLSALRHRLDSFATPNSFTTQKYALIRYQPWIRYSQGLHDVANVSVSSLPAWFAHFKYHAGFKDKVQTEIRRAQHYDNASEYWRYAAILADRQGGFGEKGISVRYEGSKSFSANRSVCV